MSLTPVQSSADVAEATLKLSKAYRACFEMQADENARLECYDALSPQIAAVTLAVTGDVTGKCKIEDWSYTRKGSNAHIVGAATCESGKLNYRLYDGETFLTSGFTYIEGFGFQTYAAIPELAEMQIKYTIDR
ncbi:hypothetical protein [Sulfitobacter sp. PM12]|uniref:hypothetical protein n=1 Tax=Sulfitobacter sp. PM12 TaxID=3138497 RepID=UPI003890BF02